MTTRLKYGIILLAAVSCVVVVAVLFDHLASPFAGGKSGNRRTTSMPADAAAPKPSLPRIAPSLSPFELGDRRGSPHYPESTPTPIPTAFPLPTPVRSPTEPQPEFLKAVSKFVAEWLELERSQQIDAILSYYAREVDYYDNGPVDHESIRLDKAERYARWSSISLALSGTPTVTRLDHDRWMVRAPTKFFVTNRWGEWVDGDVTQVLTIDTSGPQWLITAQKAEIVRRETGSGRRP